MKKEKREYYKRIFADSAFQGDSEEMAEAIISEKRLLHPAAKALLNFVRLYLWEIDYERLASIFFIHPICVRQPLLGWTVARYFDDLTDINVNPGELHPSVKLSLRMLRGEISPHKFQPRDIFEKMGQVYMLIEQKSEIKTADVLAVAARSLEVNNQRRWRVPTWEEYKKLIYYGGVCASEFFLRFAFNCNNEILHKICYNLGYVGQIFDDYIDYYKDAAVGLYNITKEEMKELGIEDPLRINEEQMQLFWKHRQALRIKHLHRLIDLQKEMHEKKDKRLLKRIIDVASRLVKPNLKPKGEYPLPFKSFAKLIMDIPDPMRYEWLYYRLGIFSTYLHW